MTDTARRSVVSRRQAAFRDIAAGLESEGFAIRRDFIEPELWREIAVYAASRWRKREFRRGGIGRGPSFEIRSDIRNDRVLWLERDSDRSIERYWSRYVEPLRLYLNRRLFLGLESFEAHLTVYPPGSFYTRHVDQHRTARHRRVSAILYLNGDWTASDQGMLRIHGGEGAQTVDVLPEGGTLVCLMSAEILHEVLPATRERFSVTGWFRTGQSDPEFSQSSCSYSK